MSRRLVDGKMPVPRKGANKGGRPKDSSPLLTDELQERICNAIRMNAFPTVAASLEGVHYDTLRQWVLKGKSDPTSRYGAFNRAIRQAIAQAEIRDLAVVDGAGQGRPAEYLMEPVLDPKTNQPIMDPTAPKDKPRVLMRPVRDAEGNPILKTPPKAPDWRAAAWKLSKRNPKFWGGTDHAVEDVMDTEAPQAVKAERETVDPKVYADKVERVKRLLKDGEELGDAEDA